MYLIGYLVTSQVTRLLRYVLDEVPVHWLGTRQCPDRGPSLCSTS